MIELIKKYEEEKGRKATDVHREKRGYDIESVGESETRYIEVKSYGKGRKPYTTIVIYPTFLRQLGKNISKFYLYITHYQQDEPMLRIVEPDLLFKNLQTTTRFEFPSTKKVLGKIKEIPLK
jgi:hypothetical protein